MIPPEGTGHFYIVLPLLILFENANHSAIPCCSPAESALSSLAPDASRVLHSSATQNSSDTMLIWSIWVLSFSQLIYHYGTPLFCTNGKSPANHRGHSMLVPRTSGFISRFSPYREKAPNRVAISARFDLSIVHWGCYLDAHPSIRGLFL